jgi:hypothetical protein
MAPTQRTGDLWQVADDFDLLCITANSYIKLLNPRT